MLRCIFGTFVLLFLAAACCPAQSDSSPHFDVASVKPVGRDVAMGYTADASQITIGRLPMTNLISMAYGVGLDQITGPDWLSTEFYAITAKLPPGATRDQYPQMFANLLAERFGLVVHRVTKIVSGYELGLSPGGSKLAPSNAEIVAGRGGFEMPKAGADGYPVLPPNMTYANRIDGGTMRMSFQKVGMAFLADRLRVILTGAGPGETIPVTDKTGISGKFDFHLEIPAPAMRLPAELRMRTGQEMAAGGDPDVGAREISAALDKQLGLRLNAVKISLDFVVVDHVIRVPTEN